MVAIVAGNGLGLFNASNNTAGSAGMLGQDLLGQAGNLAARRDKKFSTIKMLTAFTKPCSGPS